MWQREVSSVNVLCWCWREGGGCLVCHPPFPEDNIVGVVVCVWFVIAASLKPGHCSMSSADVTPDRQTFHYGEGIWTAKNGLHREDSEM